MMHICLTYNLYSTNSFLFNLTLSYVGRDRVCVFEIIKTRLFPQHTQSNSKTSKIVFHRNLVHAHRKAIPQNPLIKSSTHYWL